MPFLVPEQVPETGEYMAAKRRHWKEKDGRFWARIAVPKALQKVIGKTELMAPLGGNLRVADRSHPAAVARLQAILEKARLDVSLPPSLHVTVPQTPAITQSDLKRIAWKHYNVTLQQHEQNRANMPTPTQIADEYERLMRRIEAGEADPWRNPAGMFNVYADYELTAGARYLDQKLRERRLIALRKMVAAGETRFVDADIQEYLLSHNLTVVFGSSDWVSIGMALARAEIEALQRSLESDSGDFGGLPSDPMVTPPTAHVLASKPVPLRKLFSDYIISKQAIGHHADGGANWHYVISSLIQHLGHDDASKITKINILQWRDHLIASGLKAKTVANKYLAAVRALLRWAHDDARLPSNEAEKVMQKVPKKGRPREAGYTTPEATKILTVALAYQPAEALNPSNRESVHITAAKRWIPLLCAFTGARVTELAQLRKEDFRMEGNRWVIRITPDASSVKSGEYRDVPLHRQVIALGFFDFVNAAEDGPLFHGAKVQKGESAEQIKQRFKRNARTTSGRISEWLHDMKLVPDGVQPSHGWRHRFKTQGLELGVSTRVLDCIQGHAEPGSGSDYGDVTIPAMLHVIDALPEYELTVDRPQAIPYLIDSTL